jgi:hypothetical protein
MKFNPFYEIKPLLIDDPSDENLREGYTNLKSISIANMTRDEKKMLAEICFLLAKNMISEGDQTGEGFKLANESVSLYEELNLKNKDETIPILSNILPDFMHEGVVRNRLLKSTTV